MSGGRYFSLAFLPLEVDDKGNTKGMGGRTPEPPLLSVVPSRLSGPKSLSACPFGKAWLTRLGKEPSRFRQCQQGFPPFTAHPFH